MGAAGDMLTGALLELLPDADSFLRALNALGIPGVKVQMEKVTKCGLLGTHVSVRVNGAEEEPVDVLHHHDHAHDHEHFHNHDHGHSHDDDHHGYDSDHEHVHHHAHVHPHVHRGMDEIREIIKGLPVSEKVRRDVLEVYGLIAEAESRAHGRPVEEIHFHEVGAMDAIADITAVCMLMERIAPDRVAASPVHVGSGHVPCAHGILPVPAPATAHILRGIPSYGGSIEGELCTPTGAALLKHFVNSFGAMPIMQTEAIGYGMGKKDFPMMNGMRALLGESLDEASADMGAPAGSEGSPNARVASKDGDGSEPHAKGAFGKQEDCADLHGDSVYELSCNVDDMTPEAVSFAMDRLFEAGALEVYTVPSGMKKSRPGVLLTVLCHAEEKNRLVREMMHHTTTIGIRETLCKRYTLERRTETVQTPLGAVREKISEGFGVTRHKYEFDDLADLARANALSLEEVLACLQK
jgi:uncharacterized protein (TIGR00299 family) protein